MVKLFDFSYTEDQNLDPFLIPTPLGNIALAVFINGSDMSTSMPEINSKISKNASIYIWDRKDVHLEQLRVRLNPSLPPGMKVNNCIGILWRFKALYKIKIKFSCRIMLKEKNKEGDPESGEGLIAKSWQEKNLRLTIGTEDEEFLISRAEVQQGLPYRIASNKLIDPNCIGYLDDGLQIELPDFLKDEEGQIQFIISWNEQQTDKDLSTWYAVDVSPDEILNQVGAIFD